MSAASSLTARTAGRPLRPQELRLAAALVHGTADEAAVSGLLSGARVRDLPDGGMGGVRFLSSSSIHRAFGRTVGEAAFRDEDGTPVSAALTLDQDGALFELDLFKADNSPVRRLPSGADLERLRPI